MSQEDKTASLGNIVIGPEEKAGLRLLARLLVRAYLKDRDAKAGMQAGGFEAAGPRGPPIAEDNGSV